MTPATRAQAKIWATAQAVPAGPDMLIFAANLITKKSDAEPIEGETHYFLSQSLLKLAAQMDRDAATRWQTESRAQLAEAKVKLAEEAADVAIAELRKAEQTIAELTRDRSVLMHSMRVILNERAEPANDSMDVCLNDVKVTFVYGEHGAGGLTPEEAHELARNLHTEASEKA